MARPFNKHFLLLHFVVFIWGISPLLGRYIKVDAPELVWYRLLITVPVMLLYIRYTGQSLVIGRKQLIRLSATGLVILVHWLTFYAAIKASNISVTMVSFSTGTLFSSILEPLFYKRRVRLYEVVIGLIILAGIGLIFSIEFEYWLGILLGITAAFTSVLFSIFNSMFARDLKPAVISFYELTAAFAGATAFALLTGKMDAAFFQPDRDSVIGLILLALVCTAYPFIASVNLSKYISPYTIVLTVNLETVYGIIWAILFYKENEDLKPTFYLGVVVILFAVFLNSFLRGKAEKKHDPAAMRPKLRKKILIVRFSSIGDIVLTSPVIRSLRQQLPDCELHYVTRDSFLPLLKANPHLDRIHVFKKDIRELYAALQLENYDFIVDLHNNLRSNRLKVKLATASATFSKINLRKAMAVNFKMLNLLPPVHVVDRYFQAVAPLGVTNDGSGLEHFIPQEEDYNVRSAYPQLAGGYVALVAGGSYYTKRIPEEKLEEICELVQLPVVMLGDSNDAHVAKRLAAKFPHVLDLCGQLAINSSAAVVRDASWVITSDTGLMHIASAFKKRIVSVWGNTVPEFGMSPYMPGIGNIVIENKALKCRPCSKLGYAECPLKHFRCMRDHDLSALAGTGITRSQVSS